MAIPLALDNAPQALPRPSANGLFGAALTILLCVPSGAVFADGEGGFDFMTDTTTKPKITPSTANNAPQPLVSVAGLPRSVAILPFDNETQDQNIAEEVRRAFYNQFSSKNYADIELSAIDVKLPSLNADLAKSRYQSFCQSLGCEGVITGRVIDFRKLFAGVYSELAVVAEISLIDAQTGEIILTRKEEVSFREGGLSLTPIGLALSAMSAALNLRDVQRIRLVSELGYNIAKTVPDPLDSAGHSGPRIQGMLSNATESPFGLGKIIHIALQGDANGYAVFDIGHYRRALPMIEKKPGVYIGEYRVQDHDAVRRAPLIATLRARNGLTSHWYDTQWVDMDSQPPSPPTGLNARSQPGKISLRWDPLTNTPDLAGYQILGSTQPLTGFTPIGRVDTPYFVDLATGREPYRYYRIAALDHAGNESPPGSIVRAHLLPDKAPTLSGRIDADRELAGQIIVSGELLVPAGITLTLAPGTRMAFKPGASLLIQGELNSDSGNEPVEFVAQGGGNWKGIRVEGGNIGLRGFTLTNAAIGITLNRAQGTLESGLIQRCDTGLLINAAGSASARDLRLLENRIGARLESSDAKLTLNRITGNDVGVEMSGFTGVLRDNAIFQNKVNLRAETGTLLEVNYWGSLDPTALRIEGAMLSELLNRPAPDGKPVRLRVNPCAGLTAEACQQKATEAMIEGGRLFHAKNYGRALTQFEAAIAAQPSSDAYYFAALCHQEMQEIEPAIEGLRAGVSVFPNDPSLQRALGMLYFQKGDEALARKHIGEVLRLSPNDRQATFLFERMEGVKPKNKN